jgi:hypothetical protein
MGEYLWFDDHDFEWKRLWGEEGRKRMNGMVEMGMKNKKRKCSGIVLEKMTG